MEKLNMLTNGEKMVAGGGALMLIASFLPWYKIDFGGLGLNVGSISRNGWESPGALWSLLAVLIGIVLAGAVVGSRLGNVKLPDLGPSVTWAMVYLGGGAAAALFVLLKIANESSYMSYGFYLGIIAAALLAAGGYMIYTEEKRGSGA